MNTFYQLSASGNTIKINIMAGLYDLLLKYSMIPISKKDGQARHFSLAECFTSPATSLCCSKLTPQGL